MATAANTTVAAAAKLYTGLYVSGLDGGVTEEQLKQLFNQTGEVTSVKVCMDQTSERSLGYGYVHYANPQHAAKALELLNFTTLNGKSIRLSYSNGKIFIKNLHNAINDKGLNEFFSTYGDIVKCRVDIDSSALSKGYGFVHYDNEDSAQNAIEHVNGLILHGKSLHVEPYMDMTVDKTRFTNVFVKNISKSITEEDLKSIFGDFGLITSAVVMLDESGHSKGFGFVNFEASEDAMKSVECLNGKIFDGMKWFVGRAQKKSERVQELNIYHEQHALGMNKLFVKNIDKKIDNKKLKEFFSAFGIVMSCKIIFHREGISKGYGFIVMSTAQEASRAISEMNGKMIGSKALYVAIAERKEVSNQRLQSLHPIALSPPVSPSAPPVVSPRITMDPPRMPMYHPFGTSPVSPRIPMDYPFGAMSTPVPMHPSFVYGHVGPVMLPPPPQFGYQQRPPSSQ